MWESLYNIYVHQIIMLYILNLHNVVCQLSLSKAGKIRAKDKTVKQSMCKCAHIHYICIYTDIYNLYSFIIEMWINMKYHFFFFLKWMDKDFENKSKFNMFCDQGFCDTILENFHCHSELWKPLWSIKCLWEMHYFFNKRLQETRVWIPMRKWCRVSGG